MSKKDIAGKYTLIVATGVVATVLSMPVCAQAKPVSASDAPASSAAAAPAASATPPAATSTPPSAAAQAQQTPPVEDKAAEAKRFTEYKQQILAKIDDLMAKMKDKRSCIQASTDRDSMRACFARATQTAVPPAKAGEKSKDAPVAPQTQTPGAPPAVKK